MSIPAATCERDVSGSPSCNVRVCRTTCVNHCPDLQVREEKASRGTVYLLLGAL